MVFGAKFGNHQDHDNKVAKTCLTDMAAQALMPFAERSILQTAKVFAGAAVDLCQDQQLMREARTEFRKRTRGFKYDPLVSKKQPVPIDPP